MDMQQTLLSDLVVGAYFRYDGRIYRREEGTVSDVAYHYNKVRGPYGGGLLFRSDKTVEALETLTLQDLLPDESFTFDAWDLEPMGNGQWDPRGTFRVVRKEFQCVVVRSEDGAQQTLSYDPRVYTEAHPPSILKGCAVGTVFTVAGVSGGKPGLYTVIRASSDEHVVVSDESSRKYEILSSIRVRIWTDADKLCERIGAALARAKAEQAPVGGESLKHPIVDKVVFAPSCVLCKQPFGVYRKQVGTVCGDCVAAGTSLADQPPPAAAPEPKGDPHHWEAWETPSYEGLS